MNLSGTACNNPGFQITESYTTDANALVKKL
jgi:hypothetical protein